MISIHFIVSLSKHLLEKPHPYTSNGEDKPCSHEMRIAKGGPWDGNYKS